MVLRTRDGMTAAHREPRLARLRAHGGAAESGDARAIQIALDAADEQGREIDHGTARAIAAAWHDGGAETLAFTSTGAITTEDLWRRLFPGYASLTPTDQRAADYLGTYLVDRHRRGETGRVPGWSGDVGPVTARDFRLIAQVIAGVSADCGRAEIAQAFAQRLSLTNPRFDEPRFLTACGLRETAS